MLKLIDWVNYFAESRSLKYNSICVFELAKRLQYAGKFNTLKFVQTLSRIRDCQFLRVFPFGTTAILGGYYRAFEIKFQIKTSQKSMLLSRSSIRDKRNVQNYYAFCYRNRSTLTKSDCVIDCIPCSMNVIR